MAEKIRVILPKKYDLVVGDTFQLFYRGVIEAPNPYVYAIVSICEKGRNFPRYFEYTPTEPGEHKLELRIYDAARNLVGSGETILNVVQPKAPDRCINILAVGDSLTTDGQWQKEFRRRITTDGGEPKGLGFDGAVNFVGTHHVGDISNEAYGGWSWTTFMKSFKNYVYFECRNDRSIEDLNSIWQDANGALWQLEGVAFDYLKFSRYLDHDSPIPECGTLTHVKGAVDTSPIEFKSYLTSIGSPFYDPEKQCIDITSYAKRNNIEKVDLIYILLGANGLVGKIANSLPRPEYCQYIVNGTKELVAKLREAFPNAVIKLMSNPGFSPTGGPATIYGAKLPLTDTYELNYYQHELNLAYQSWCLEDEYKEFMEYINLAGQFDIEYNMPYTMRKVNIRSQMTERLNTDGVHPAMDGYMQIADAIYRNFVSSFCSE